ncbi:PREDICTED: uncharacterized protein LOC107070328 [Polistes dominula]|uniref:Uncharacterized protein LOC107070328 n=1 Tax=Polistes dominula TaxID=743375 RepID=A0ABM1IUL4_POLDO|nr:PREDICTED: uncharacterized protein LOC107070328 [Polistes dominula]XP_015183902.1 PREDICTED: uncharacterized protein LOC107070328 [Polistes dominula]XP_015183903.1 PREDICTED: uncharacterized protein LOC107070328 [Polistes dominula]XP_015183904.1 PREDICTED: uncharacterized protein LOC107070328 [Polistes dominula]
MALRLRGSKDVKKSSYYVWYLGAREAKGVDAMPSAIAYLLERERLQEPFKVTLQVSSKGLKIIQTVLPGGSTRSAVKHLVPGHAVLAAVQREDIVAATLLLPNPATNNPVHVHAYRCDSVETAELLGGQLKALASQADNLVRVSSGEGRIRSNLGSDGRSTRESESSEGSGESKHDPIQTTTIYESLAAELRAKLGRGNSGDNDVGPILLPPRDYDTVHRHRGNLAGIEFRRCLNQTIVGGSTAVDRGGTRSAASSGIGSDSAATPPPYQSHHPLGPRPSRPSRDSSSDDDWGGAGTEESHYFPDVETTGSSLTLPRLPRSPERHPTQQQTQTRGVSPGCNRNRRAPELRQRSPSPQYQPRINPGEVTSPRERFQDAKEMFRAMEREAIARPVLSRQRESDGHHHVHRVESSRQVHEDRSIRSHQTNVNSSSSVHEQQQQQQIRRSHPELDRENELPYRARPRPRTHHYGIENSESETTTRPRPRSFYENPVVGREFRDQRNSIDPRESRDFRDRAYTRELREKVRARATTYQELSEHERYPGLDRESARPPLEIVPTPGRYRHSYAEPPRLGLAALHPY